MASDGNLKSDQGDLPALREVFLGGFSKVSAYFDVIWRSLTQHISNSWLVTVLIQMLTRLLQFWS